MNSRLIFKGTAPHPSNFDLALAELSNMTIDNVTPPLAPLATRNDKQTLSSLRCLQTALRSLLALYFS